METICSICGMSTATVDYDYLVGTNHLSCELQKENKKVMKIKGWEKISGFTYKGYTIVNPMHNAEETKYFATILDLNHPQKPKWELSVITPQHKFMIGDTTLIGTFIVILRDNEGRSTTQDIHRDRMKSISIFRNTFEEMIDKLLAMRLTSAGVVTGIVNVVNNSGTNIVYQNGNPILK